MSTRTIARAEVIGLTVLLLVVAGVLFLAGRTGAAPSASAESGLTPLQQQGRAVFLRERCLFCHPAGSGERVRRYTYLDRLLLGWVRPGPDLSNAATHRTDDWQIAHLLDPQAIVANSPMPSARHLSDADLKALVAYLQRGKKTEERGVQWVEAAEIPLVERSLDTYRSGRELYRVHCAGCHGWEGNGAGSVGHLLNPEPRDFTDTSWMDKQTDVYLFSVIANGKPGTAMPGYRELLGDQELAKLLNYIRYYADATARQRMEEGLPE